MQQSPFDVTAYTVYQAYNGSEIMQNIESSITVFVSQYNMYVTAQFTTADPLSSWSTHFEAGRS